MKKIKFYDRVNRKSVSTDKYKIEIKCVKGVKKKFAVPEDENLFWRVLK